MPGVVNDDTTGILVKIAGEGANFPAANQVVQVWIILRKSCDFFSAKWRER
jgi:hypothetical protein